MDLETIAKTAKHNHEVKKAGLAIIPEGSELCLVYDREHKEFVTSDIGNMIRIDYANSTDEEEMPLVDIDPVGVIVESYRHVVDLIQITRKYGIDTALRYEARVLGTDVKNAENYIIGSRAA